MNDAEIIVALGDSTLVADALGLTQQAVTNWKVRGISWPSRVAVRDLARRKRVKLPDDFLSVKRPG